MCFSCNSGYTRTTNPTTKELYCKSNSSFGNVQKCKCTNGIAKTQTTACNKHLCKSCNAGFVLTHNKGNGEYTCVRKSTTAGVCSCPGGAPWSNNYCKTGSREMCMSCFPGY